MVTISAIQATPIFLNKEKSVEKACTLIKEAGKKADLVVFPEAFIPGYPDWVWLVKNSDSTQLNDLYVELHKNAITIPDESTKKLCEAAKISKTNVVIGIHERNSEKSNSSLYNTMLYISDEGIILGKHRKLIPTGGERLVWSQGDGSTLNAFNTNIGKVGGLLCWENYMPLARNSMYEQGVQIYATPTWDNSDSWITSMKHIAWEGGMFLISCCQVVHKKDIPEKFAFKKGYSKEIINRGNSCIINPKGEIIAGPLKEKEGILYADIDLSDITKAKRMFDVAGHYARPDVFEYKVKRI